VSAHLHKPLGGLRLVNLYFDMALENQVAQPTETVDTSTQNTEVVNQETVIDPNAEPAVQAPETDAEIQARKMQRAIDRQTAKKYEARQEADALRRENQQLIERLNKGGGAVDEPQRVDVEAIVSHRAQELVAQREFNRRSDAVVQAGKKLDGFQEAMQELGQEVQLFNDRNGPSPFLEAVMDTDVPELILLHLGKNPDEAAEFKGLSAAQIGRRIARLETKLSNEAKVKTSSAPKPLSPVSGGAKAGEPDPDKDMAAWINSRNVKARSSAYL
jgi:hypothetical protein